MRKDGLYWLRKHGGRPMDGRGVTILEHSLQCAALAVADGAPDALVVAALLHDVGRLLPESVSNATGSDRAHELLGARFIGRTFAPEVSEPVRLHIEAKRYLAHDPAYAASMSEAARDALAEQGGAYAEWQVEGFSAVPYAEDAIRLRRWDDRAIVPGLDVPCLEHYVGRIERLLRPRLTVSG